MPGPLWPPEKIFDSVYVYICNHTRKSTHSRKKVCVKIITFTHGYRTFSDLKSAYISGNSDQCMLKHLINIVNYTCRFETALRQTDKTVVLPYWNSAMDNNEITRPVNSVIFSDKFLGNGNGNVNTGPFRNWKDFRGCPLPRNISVGKPLLSPEIVNMIETCDSVNLTESVVDGGPSCASLTIEGQHNLVHDWVGGDMGDLALSANDPAFILHHAFADYIWEKFRQKQRKLGINPEMDYPSIGKVTKNSDLRKFHVANRTMDCFPWITNMEGYWNNFTDLYEYEDSPTCPSCGNSKYLTCNMAINVCIGNVPKPPNAPMSTHLTLIIAVVSILGVLTILSAALACVSGYRSRNKPRIGEKERLLANSADLHTKIHT